MNYAKYLEACDKVILCNVPILISIIDENDYLFDEYDYGPTHVEFKTNDEFSENVRMYFGVDSDGVFKTRVVYDGLEIASCSGDLFTAAEGAAVLNSVLSSLYYVNRHSRSRDLIDFLNAFCKELTRVESAYELIYDLYIHDNDSYAND